MSVATVSSITQSFLAMLLALGVSLPKVSNTLLLLSFVATAFHELLYPRLAMVWWWWRKGSRHLSQVVSMVLHSDGRGMNFLLRCKLQHMVHSLKWKHC
ncbi:hypothetical protein BKA61DRAFT_622026 [Leptodontidium sp. MPI-SDFR-AT-0119]|nr:hypothetical protein BKA61DRAFT_622026 [Leptodontidium sp. MPI-SDFR-AT-0119]